MRGNLDRTAVVWRKSSYSEGGDGNCVEVAGGSPSVVPVRDSKVPHGPALVFPAPAWAAFLAGLRGPDKSTP
ncbi:DUF397 domain-containing protein [Streptomyces somaliensis DSM 40738]|uniref:DUF397 domain-containing protein n=1 Tax=Streptomyces somaliensis (strain ATCC 33201 / DSM 40738 / JCM 12659 / KCTC 9044 / NCTC 11332 / NRRL B-12077 / IP 733) TaxID=1134445 RepID=A0AA44DD14_STRE0|nr:DUF397 domain-containing protein [Streptomyces somaliensis]MCQ0022776.1 DUF397 domain-containing protein [Streptomyces somaliensis DSM 40738]NKY14638.1 DUF397 domain-containing protein [Streptomyces somaliensis DSM 40738]